MAMFCEILKGCCGVVAVVSWFLLVVSYIVMIANRKEGEPILKGIFGGPHRFLYHPEQLAARGLVARRFVLIGMGGFLSSWLIVMLIGTLLGEVHFFPR